MNNILNAAQMKTALADARQLEPAERFEALADLARSELSF